METLFHIIDAMLTTACCATMNELLMFSIKFFGLLFALSILIVSALRLCVQSIIKKSRK